MSEVWNLMCEVWNLMSEAWNLMCEVWGICVKCMFENYVWSFMYDFRCVKFVWEVYMFKCFTMPLIWRTIHIKYRIYRIYKTSFLRFCCFIMLLFHIIASCWYLYMISYWHDVILTWLYIDLLHFVIISWCIQKHYHPEWNMK